MNNQSIIVAVRPEQYDRVEMHLEASYVLSANQNSQEMVLDSIPKFKPHAIILHDGLAGSRSASEFYAVLKATFPKLLIILYAEDMIDYLIPYIKGEKAVPDYYSSPAQEPEETKIIVPFEASNNEELDVEADEEDSKAKSRKWQNKNRVGKSILFSDAEREYELDDWDRTAEATIDIHAVEKKTVVVTGASGGIGKTDMSINFAVHAAKKGFKTVLCGFNLQNDDLAGRLGLEYRRGQKLLSAFELYTHNALNISGLEDILQDYKGLKVLIGIEKPEERQDMDEEFFRQMVRILKANYDLVVIDTENNSYSPAYFSVIELADHVLVPCTTHNSVLEQLRDELFSWKDDFDIPLSKVDIIFNKAGEGGFVTKDHIEKNTTREVIAVIPYSKDVLRGSEREEPAVLRRSSDAGRIRKEMDKVLFRIFGRAGKGQEFIKKKFTLFWGRVSKYVESSKSR